MTPERYRSLKAALNRRQPDLTVIAEGVHKSHNLSAIARSCDATGVFAVHVVAPGDEFERHRLTAGGAWKWLRVRCHDTIEIAADYFKKHNYQILAATISETSVDYRRVDYTSPTAIILGAELTGITDRAARLADQHVSIPMRGLVESLNVSVAAALLLSEAARQRESAGLYETCRLDAQTWRTTLFEWCYPDIARRCRQQNLSYPDLDADGYLAENPFSASGR